MPAFSYKDEDDFNKPEPNCLETRQECVEMRQECVETRTECMETRAEGVETRAECVETRAECVETRTKCMETRAECMETWAECVETRAVQDRKPKEVIVTTYPILVHIFYINFVRHKKIYKVKIDRPPVKGKESVEIEKGLPTQGNDVLTPVHEECNPKVKSERRIGYSSPPIHKRRNPKVRITRGSGSGSKEKRGIVEVATPVTVKHKKQLKQLGEEEIRQAQEGETQIEERIRWSPRANYRRRLKKPGP